MSIYPDAKRGALGVEKASYAASSSRLGPKERDLQKVITLIGIIFFALFLLGFAVYAGLLSYFAE